MRNIVYAVRKGNKMYMLKFFIYAVTFGVAVWVIYALMVNIEHTLCFIRRQVPFVPSCDALRRAVVREINKNYASMCTACDIGAGYGTLSRMVARRCNMSTVALENMLFSCSVSKLTDFVTRANNQTIWCDAFEYLKSGIHFDVGIAYLGPVVNQRLAEFMDVFRVLIVLDVPIDGLTPTRVVSVGHGCTRYGRLKFPHRLYIYENDK